MNTKLHGPIRLFMTAGRVSDYTGAAALLSSLLPNADWLLADRGYNADWFHSALQDKRDQTLHPWQEVPRKARGI